MGLKFPDDLEAWREWHNNAKIEKRGKNRLKKLLKRQDNTSASAQGFLHIVGENPRVLIVLDSTSPTSIASLLRPVKYMQESFAVLAPQNIKNDYAEVEKAVVENVVSSDLVGYLPAIRIMLSAGHYLPLGQATYEISQKNKIQYFVVQHGLNTPFAPPLPHNATLFAFSQTEAEFWISGRQDISYEVVGSQLFYESYQKTSPNRIADISEEIVFLGQMHGAELPRLSFAKSSYDFCKKHDAVYRPHPSEKDKISTLTHKLWEKQGIKLDTSGTPLNQSNSPVVSIFSTGVLEAAIRGIPAWVYHSNPPAWLKEFWDRYGMNQWGSEPTPAPAQPEIEPALAIAKYIAHRLEK